MYRALNRGAEEGLANVQMSEIRQQLSSVLLCYAAVNGFDDDLLQMVATGAGVNSGDYDSRTALHLSASVGNAACVRALLASKAAVDVEDRWHHTPLQVCVVAWM